MKQVYTAEIICWPEPFLLPWQPAALWENNKMAADWTVSPLLDSEIFTCAFLTFYIIFYKHGSES